MTIVWSVVIALGLILELFTFELVSIWFAVGAILALILQIVGVSVVWQIVAFFVLSIVAIAVTRPLFKRILSKSEGNTNLDAEIGTSVKVSTAIIGDEKGTVKINGVVWNAIEINGKDCLPKEVVKVIKFEGTTVVVEKSSQQSETAQDTAIDDSKQDVDEKSEDSAQK